MSLLVTQSNLSPEKKSVSIFVKDESVLYVILSSTLQFEKNKH